MAFLLCRQANIRFLMSLSLNKSLEKKPLRFFNYFWSIERLWTFGFNVCRFGMQMREKKKSEPQKFPFLSSLIIPTPKSTPSYIHNSHAYYFDKIAHLILYKGTNWIIFTIGEDDIIIVEQNKKSLMFNMKKMVLSMVHLARLLFLMGWHVSLLRICLVIHGAQ